MIASVVEYESTIMERLMTSPEAAQAILSIKFSPQDEQRMHELIDKNNKGDLTESEQAEMESYRRIGNFLGILQAKARLYVKHPPSNL